jgi:hypothetical protein
VFLQESEIIPDFGGGKTPLDEEEKKMEQEMEGDVDQEMEGMKEGAGDEDVSLDALQKRAPPAWGGGEEEGFRWEDAGLEFVIYAPLPEGACGKDVVCDIGAGRLSVTIKGREVVRNVELYKRVKR